MWFLDWAALKAWWPTYIQASSHPLYASWRTSHPTSDFLNLRIFTGWWFGTCFILPYIGNNHPNWLIFFRGVGQPPTRHLITPGVNQLLSGIPRANRRGRRAHWAVRRSSTSRSWRSWNLAADVSWRMRRDGVCWWRGKHVGGYLINDSCRWMLGGFLKERI